jgi:hypothetical protein
VFAGEVPFPGEVISGVAPAREFAGVELFPFAPATLNITGVRAISLMGSTKIGCEESR